MTGRFADRASGGEAAPTAGTAQALSALQSGRVAAAQAASPSMTADRKTALLAEARGHYDEARQALEAAEMAAAERLREYARKIDDAKDAAAPLRRRQARSELIEVGLYLAAVQYELAGTWQPQEPEHKKHLAAAIVKYGELFQKHGTLAGGLYARLWQARLWKQSGEPQKAIEALQPMLKLPDNDETFRRLRNDSLILLLETCLLPEVKKYPEAISWAQQWASSIREGDPAGPDALRIQYLAGTAAMEYARSFAQSDARHRENVETARNSLGFVAQYPGPLRREAIRRLTDPLFGDWTEDPSRPATWDEARCRGDFAWERLQRAQARLQQMALEHKDQGTEYEKVQRQFLRARDESLRQHVRAASLAGPTVPLADRNEVRFRLAWLYWAAGDMERAGIMGEFFVGRYPQWPEARPAAEIAAKAWRTAFRLARSEPERAFAAGRLADLAAQMEQYWPRTPETETAWMMLIDTAVDRQEGGRVEEYLARVPPGSPRRTLAEQRAARQVGPASRAGP